MAVNHYENFPVASFLLPSALRPPVKVIYAFARTADDMADEGDATASERLKALGKYETALDNIRDQVSNAGHASAPLFHDLQGVVAKWKLPIAAFYNLLSAFKQDVTTTRYPNYATLLDYCRRSANPVGTLMLHLYAVPTAENLRQSDAICSALQIINFLQDVAVDWEKDRIYIPLEDLHRFQVDETTIAQGHVTGQWQALMSFEIDRVRALMFSGAPLALRLPGRIGWELRLVVQGGLRILTRIEQVGYDVFSKRPVLGIRDWIAIGLAALRMRA
jgi:squalene synthase HpnC